MTTKSPVTVDTKLNPEHEKLIEILKFTPRTYTVNMWGYGGEYIMGTVDRKIYDYFRHRRLDLSEFAWDSDYADEHNIPEEMWPFPPGSYYDCDDIGHVYGVDRSCGTLQICDEKGAVVYERSLESLDGCDDSPELTWGDEYWIDMKPAGTVVFLGVSSEKGSFFEGEFELREPFDISKLSLEIEDFDGNEIISSVYYDNEDIENAGANTNGKGSDFGFWIAGSRKDGEWERYRNMDDIKYPMTDWFPKKIKPVREGHYNVKTAGKNSYEHTARWTGEKWTSTYNDDELNIKEWQGLAVDPDLES